MQHGVLLKRAKNWQSWNVRDICHGCLLFCQKIFMKWGKKIYNHVKIYVSYRIHDFQPWPCHAITLQPNQCNLLVVR